MKPSSSRMKVAEQAMSIPPMFFTTPHSICIAAMLYRLLFLRKIVTISQISLACDGEGEN